ncbi:histidine triad nucleotide-binding protein 3 isoform X2 [Drosophila hydei]|uniref:Adenosine 5'-monophosphoramidase HINT3 n=1 Tax=Drosophila hydei TaxID=7224 RepID=A0A6J1M665_DROHY|nr:histidine triad nucleotide-binding protein 3 isoform X2 [Drosophila hydei]
MSSIGLPIVLFTAMVWTKFRLTNEMDGPSCVFCDIVKGKSETILEAESEEFVIFRDIKPAAPNHYLIVPKQHYDSLKTLDESHITMVRHMEKEIKAFFVSKGISTQDAIFGFHYPPFISVKHLHMHGIAPRSQMSFVSQMTYKPSTPWFKTTEDALACLRTKEKCSPP